MDWGSPDKTPGRWGRKLPTAPLLLQIECIGSTPILNELGESGHNLLGRKAANCTSTSDFEIIHKRADGRPPKLHSMEGGESRTLFTKPVGPEVPR